MAKIEISTIREYASSLEELNEGHLLYQRKEYSSFEFDILRVPTLTINAKATFEGNDVSLKYDYNKALGTCQCLKNKKGLCRHEVCLFFLIRDRLNEMLKDKKSEEAFYMAAKQDELMQELMEINITRNVYPYIIKPVISFLNTRLSLAFEFSCQKNEKRIYDIKSFLEAVESKSKLTINKVEYQMDYKYFDSSSQRLLDLCYLNINSMDLEIDNTFVSNEFLLFLYYLNKEEILLSYDSLIKTVKFKEEMPHVRIIADNKRLSLNTTNITLLKTHSKSFAFQGDFCYVINGSDKLYASLLDVLLMNKFIDLDDRNFEIFLNNIYPSYSKQISYLDYKPTKEIKIDTYFDYKNGSLYLKYEGDFKDETFYLKKKNYKLLIKELGFNKDNEYSINDFDLICEILNEKINFFKEYGDIYLSDSINRLKFINMNKERLHIKMQDSLLKLSFEDTVYKSSELKDILLAYKNHNKYVKLKDGSILQIDDETAKMYQKLVDEIGIDKIQDETDIPFYQAYFLSSRFGAIIESKNVLESFSTSLIDYKNYNFKPHDEISSLLREYQLEGFRWLKVLADHSLGGILADDMGLGKTLEIISLIDTLPKDRAYLVVAPTSLIFNWEMEFRKFAPWLDIAVIYGGNRTEEFIVESFNKNKVIITSYDSIRMDIEKYQNLSFKLIVIDEAQQIKNPDTQKAQAIKKLKSDTRFALTGTPVENSLLDLWSIFDFTLPGYLKSKNEFTKAYENFQNPILLNELNKKTSPFVLRRLKGDVLDLEDKIENYSFSFMTDDERKLYDKYLLDAKKELQGDFKMSHVLSLLTRLRELACEPRLFLDNVDTPNSKMDSMMEIVNEKVSEGHKILIFSQFTSIFPFMGKRLNDAGIRYLELTGKTDAKDRVEMTNEFNSNPDIKVFLISLKAGGTGLNLTSADTVIHYDPWWNLAAMNQATDRAHRMGQKNIVHVIKMINKNTIEEKIVELQNKKKMLSDEVINDEDIIARMTKDDIKELFK